MRPLPSAGSVPVSHDGELHAMLPPALPERGRIRLVYDFVRARGQGEIDELDLVRRSVECVTERHRRCPALGSCDCARHRTRGRGTPSVDPYDLDLQQVGPEKTEIPRRGGREQ